MMQALMLTTILMLGVAAGCVLAPYTQWMISLRAGVTLVPASSASIGLSLFAPIANGIGWMLAWALIPSHAEAMELGLLFTAAIALTAIDMKIRIIPNELVAALLAMSVAFAIMENGFAVLPSRLLGLVVSLVLFLATALLGGQGKIGGGDIKLAVAIGFAAGFPNILIAVVAMGAAALVSWFIKTTPWSIRIKTPMPFAGFMMIGLIAALILDKVKLLTALLGL